LSAKNSSAIASEKTLQGNSSSSADALFENVAAILEQARGNVVRAINTSMVLAYWLIGREIVEAIQQGEKRAGYGEQIISKLSERLTVRFGNGFSKANIKNFRQFYLAYSERRDRIGYPLGSKSFSPQLTWSHYRALMRIENKDARDFYEQEAIEGGWDKRTLERQIQSFYYERLQKGAHPQKMLTDGRSLQIQPVIPAETLRNPYVLEFLGLPESAALHESDVERAILTHLQRFLLELGNGFAFVARQKHIRIEEQDRYIDLVFYHCRLKFYLLIDLKVGELTHADIGQMDGYVRMFDGLFVAPDDNPTIGLILCTEKNETVAKYSVLNDRKQIFASKYMLCLPTEEQLSREIESERRILENAREIANTA
jgi:predicted nuclease of restriction endonuclease-like (RecB) superfamily